MPRVRKTVGVHEHTVQDAANVVPFKRPRKSPMPRKQVIGHIKVDPRVWKVVMRLYNGDSECLEIRSKTEVVIHNNHNWRKRYATA